MNTFQGDCIKHAVTNVRILQEEMYINFCLNEGFKLNTVVKTSKVKIVSIIALGKRIIFIKVSLGVVNAFHILFNNSMIFYNLHKFLFIFRSNATICIIIKIHS